MQADRTLEALEETYWLPDEDFYAFATAYPGAPTLSETSGALSDADLRENSTMLSDANRDLGEVEIIRENTALQGVPMWWGLTDDAHSQQAITAYGSAGIATDWGARILTKESDLYDPLSYHNGSVWPLFTGWTSMGAYQYGRPHVGAQALYATALLTRQDALGYVTELLSGDYNAAFGRTSHHQIWSEAMVATPLVRGLLGVEVRDGGSTVRIAPQLPIDWTYARVQNAPAGAGTFGLDVERSDDVYTVRLDGLEGGAVEVAPALPLDAVVSRATAGGRDVPFETVRQGDVQRPTVRLDDVGGAVEVRYELERAGTDVAVRYEPAPPGATSQQIRVLRSTASDDALTLLLEGRAGQTYEVAGYTDRQIGPVRAGGVEVLENARVAPGPVGGPEVLAGGPRVHAPRHVRGHAGRGARGTFAARSSSRSADPPFGSPRPCVLSPMPAPPVPSERAGRRKLPSWTGGAGGGGRDEHLARREQTAPPRPARAGWSSEARRSANLRPPRPARRRRGGASLRIRGRRGAGWPCWSSS